MAESDFEEQIDALFLSLEDALDESALDFDYENSGGVFKITLEGCAPIILNRHGPTRQLWLATKTDGYHLAYSAEQGAWLCTRSGDDLAELWQQASAEQFGEAIVWP